jgi:hypothetical protein
MFGLTNSERNHGEDVKEYYFYLDSTPTHSYMKLLYKYPHAVYRYDDLVVTNTQRSRTGMEYELLDTGVFVEDLCFNVFVEYAKKSPTEIDPTRMNGLAWTSARARQTSLMRGLRTVELWWLGSSGHADFDDAPVSATRSSPRARPKF